MGLHFQPLAILIANFTTLNKAIPLILLADRGRLLPAYAFQNPHLAFSIY